MITTIEYKFKYKNMEYNNTFENIMPTLNDKSARLIFVDFPFNTTKAKWDTPVNLELFWKEAWRILLDNGVVIAKAQPPFNITLGASQLKYFKYEWIWEKSSATGGLNSKYCPMKASENLMVFYKKTPIYNPQMTTGHIRKISSAKSRNACIERRNMKEDYIYNKEIINKVNDYNSTNRYPRNILKFSSDKQKLAIHPTQTPEALIEYFIKTYTNEGEVVLDPCRGVNGVGVCCDKLNRKAILIEKSEKFYKMGLLRREFPQLKTKEIKQKYLEFYHIDYDLEKS
jgi:DNA modification methylase